MKAVVAAVVDVGFGFVDHDLEIAAILKFGAHPLGVFIEFGGIVGTGEQVLEEDGVGNADGPQVLHGPAQQAGLDMLIAGENNLADFDLRALLDHEGEAQGSGRNGPNLGADGGELTAVLGEQLLDHHLSAFDLGGVVLAFDRKAPLYVP